MTNYLPARFSYATLLLVFMALLTTPAFSATEADPACTQQLDYPVTGEMGSGINQVVYGMDRNASGDCAQRAGDETVTDVGEPINLLADLNDQAEDL